MSTNNKTKWIEYFTSLFLDGGFDLTKHTSEEKEIIIKGFLAPQICKSLDIGDKWMFDMYWEALMISEFNIALMGSIDASMFKERAKQNKN